jgi:hypothetical protein
VCISGSENLHSLCVKYWRSVCLWECECDCVYWCVCWEKMNSFWNYTFHWILTSLYLYVSVSQPQPNWQWVRWHVVVDTVLWLWDVFIYCWSIKTRYH